MEALALGPTRAWREGTLLEPARPRAGESGVDFPQRPEGRPSPLRGQAVSSARADRRQRLFLGEFRQYYPFIMVGWVLKKILGSKNQREIKRLMPTVRRINELDEQFKSLSDDALRAKTAAWQAELSAITDLEEQWKKLDEIGRASCRERV